MGGQFRERTMWAGRLTAASFCGVSRPRRPCGSPPRGLPGHEGLPGQGWALGHGLILQPPSLSSLSPVTDEAEENLVRSEAEENLVRRAPTESPCIARPTAG